LYGSSFGCVLKLFDTLTMYGDNTSRSKNSLPGTSHGKTSSSHGTGSSNNPGTSHGTTKGAASRKGSPGGGSSEHLYGNSSYGNIMSGVDTSVSSVNSSMLGLQARYIYATVFPFVGIRLTARSQARNKPHIVKDPKQRQSMDGPMITMEVT
jgi:hypothetical protein